MAEGFYARLGFEPVGPDPYRVLKIGGAPFHLVRMRKDIA